MAKKKESSEDDATAWVAFKREAARLEKEADDAGWPDAVKYKPSKAEKVDNPGIESLYTVHPRLFAGFTTEIWKEIYYESGIVGAVSWPIALDRIKEYRRNKFEELFPARENPPLMDPSTTKSEGGEYDSGTELADIDKEYDEAEKKGVVGDHRKGTAENAANFAKNVAAALERYGGSITKVAKACGQKPNLSTIANWKGQGAVSTVKLTVNIVNFARVLGVEPLSLWEDHLTILGPVLVDASLGGPALLPQDTRVTSSAVADLPAKIKRLGSRDGLLVASLVDSLAEKYPG